MRSSHLFRFGLASLALLALAPALLSAQVVTGTIVEEESGEPLATAYLTLLRAEGSEQARALSDSRGRFVLRAPGPGRYTVRAERIGRAAVTHGPFDLAAGETLQIELRAASQAISLVGLEVSARRQCVLDPDEATELGTVWEQARLALQVESLARAEGVFRYRLEDYFRELTDDGRRVTAQQVRPRSGFFRRTYVSAPVDELLDEGWVREDPRTREWVYHAPDGDVLLSERFRNAHCFNLASHPQDPSLLGLTFEPVPESRGMGLAGTLWLARNSAELRLLTFRYLGLPGGADAGTTIPEAALGGEVEFLALPNGAFVVKRWHIRMPRLEQSSFTYMGRTERRAVVAGIMEQGGEALEVSRVGGEVVYATDRPAPVTTILAVSPESLEREQVQGMCANPSSPRWSVAHERLRRVDPGAVEGSVLHAADRGPAVGHTVTLVDEVFTLMGSWDSGVLRTMTWVVETETDVEGAYALCARPFLGWSGRIDPPSFRLEVRDPAGRNRYSASVRPEQWRVLVYNVVLPEG